MKLKILKNCKIAFDNIQGDKYYTQLGVFEK